MAQQTTSTLDDTLLRVFSKEKLFEPCERSKTRFWDEMEEADDERPGGAGRFFRIIGSLGHGQGNPAEGGDWATARNRLEVQCSVTGAQIDSSVEMSTKFLEAAKDDGSFYGDAEAEGVIETTKGLFTYADILLGCGHKTGRLAIVEANTSAALTFTAKRPESVFQLRPNQPVDFVNLDTGGTVQDSAIITDIDPVTRVVTIDSTATLTAGWGVYQAAVYGNPMPNGLRNIVDDGDFASTVFGVARAAPNTFLNATVMDGSGGLQDYSEELVNELLDQVTFRQDMIPTQLRCNQGILSEHKRVVAPDRSYVNPGSKGSDYNTGVNHESLTFQYGAVKIPFKGDRNLPSRELYALYMPGFKKHTLRKADWSRGKGGAILQLKPSTDTYAHALVGNMMMDLTISSRKLNANGKLGNIRDRSAARD